MVVFEDPLKKNKTKPKIEMAEEKVKSRKLTFQCQSCKILLLMFQNKSTMANTLRVYLAGSALVYWERMFDIWIKLC